MKRSIYIAALLSVWCTSSTCTAQSVDSAKVVNSVLKCWRSISHEYATIYGLEEDEIKKYARQKVCFTKDSVVMYYGPLYSPRFSVKKVNAEDYAKNNFDCSKERLGMLRDSVYEITISSISRSAHNGAAHKMTDVVVFDGDCMYIVQDGVIFKLFDNDAKKESRGAN